MAALVSRLKELRASGRITVVVTHDLDVADRLLDRVAVLKDGRLVALGRRARAGYASTTGRTLSKDQESGFRNQ